MFGVSFLFGAVAYGFAHAFEPDHMAAVSNFVASRPRPREALSFGVKWALGHGVALLILGVSLYLLRRALEEHQPAIFASGILEKVVAIVLIALGINALRIAFSRRQNEHSHSHEAPKNAHFANKILGGSVLMGLLHGAAGTGAFIGAAALSLSGNLGMVLFYTLLFSLGVLLAMGVYAGALGGLFTLGARRSESILRGARVLVGVLTIGIGVCILNDVSLPGVFDAWVSH